MFTSMFRSLYNHSDKKTEIEKNNAKLKIIEYIRQNIEQLLNDDTELDGEVKENLDYGDNPSTLKNYVDMGIEFLAILDNTYTKYVNNSSVNSFNSTPNEVGSITENKQVFDKVKDPNKNILFNQINKLHCPFTWNIKPMCKNKTIISKQNKYGEYNLNISLPQFTFERYIGNLVISYEMFHNGKSKLAEMKVLEIGKWLEELDNETDEFYLSIKTGLKHVIKSTFIHMLFASNLTEECKWLLSDIDSFDSMDSKSKATIFAIRAAVLTEYGKCPRFFKMACKYALNACKFDPNTSHWFYIYSLAMTAERHYLYSFKSCPTKYEINAIDHAIMLSCGRNTSFNYQKMKLHNDIIIYNFKNSKNQHDKYVKEKNLQENKQTVFMIRNIINMKPKDPLLVVKCAKMLFTLPFLVRDSKLGIIYLKKAIKMAPTDPTVLHAVKIAFEAYKTISKKNNYKTKITQNQPSLKNLLQKELAFIVEKHKNGEDAICYLTDLASNYSGYLKYKIMSEICSYTILFTNNFKVGVEQFITLIEQPEIMNSSLITKHFSSFSSVEFNLAELFCNEILLAAYSNDNSSADILFYFKMLTKIMKICNLNIKYVDSSMKLRLRDGTSAQNTSNKKETNLPIDQFLLLKYRNNGHKEKTSYQEFSQVLKLDDATIKQKNISNKKLPKNYDLNIFKSKPQEVNVDDIDEFKFGKILNLSLGVPRSFNNSHLTLEKHCNVQIYTELENYTKQLYKNIIINMRQKQYNSLHTSQDLNMFFNQNYVRFRPTCEQYTSQSHILKSLSKLLPPRN